MVEINKKIIALWSLNPTWINWVKPVLLRKGYESKEIMNDECLKNYKVVLSDVWSEHEINKQL